MLNLLDILSEDEIDQIKQYQELVERYKKGFIDTFEMVDLSDSCILPLCKKIMKMKNENDILRILEHFPEGFYKTEILTSLRLRKHRAI